MGMRAAGSVWEWSFTGGNEIASGYRTGFMGGACTPPTERRLQVGEPLMVDLHSMFKLALGDHTHNYLLAPASPRQCWHARNFVDLVRLCLQTYKAGVSPSSLADEMLLFCEERGFNEMLICAIQYACPEEKIGFRYENAILITKDGCEKCRVLLWYNFTEPTTV